MSIRLKGLQAVEEALKKELAKLSTSKYALVGIHEAAGMAEGNQLTQAAVGAYNHFGTDNIPARPWLDVGVAQGIQDYLEIIQEGIQKGLSTDQIMNQIGIESSGHVQQYITDLKTPENAKSTIRRKKSDNPLIEDGHMRAAVTYTVTSKKPGFGL